MKRPILVTLPVAIVFIIACLFFSEGIALAATTTTVTTGNNTTLLASLYAQLATLKAEIAALEGAPATTSAQAILTTSCAPVTLTHSLALGSTGREVSSLQTFLKNQSYYTYPSITGYFGLITKTAVIAFQTANGIDPIGIVGPITRARIGASSAECESLITSPQAVPPSPVATSTPIATTTTATGASAVPIPQPIATDNTPGFGGGGGASTSVSESAPPDWVLSGAAEDLDFADQQYYGGTLDSLISTSRASPETCNWSDGSVTYAATDTPCITDLGLAIWQGSTNLLEDSGDLSGSAWSNYTTGSGTVIVTGDASTSPDGTQTAALVTVDVTDGANPTDEAVREQPFAATAAPYSDSIWLKAAAPSDVGDVIVLGISTDWWVDSTRVILTDQWSRYSVNDETLSTDGDSELFIGYWAARDIPQDGSVSFLAWGAQAEAGPAPTAYIPTASSTASRAADDITAAGAFASTLAENSGAVNVYTSGSVPGAAGTLVDADGSSLVGKTSDDALTSDVSTTLTNSNPAAWQGEAVSGLSWNKSGRSLSLNDAIVSDGQATTPAAPFTIGSTEGSSSFFNGYVMRLTAWPSNVSNATLSAMPNLDNKTYYVSASGNDDNNGTSPSTPWQSVAKVNAGTYYPGDEILFSGGDTFDGCLIFTNENTFSTSTDALTVGSYGAGRFTLNADCPYYKSEGLFLSGVGGFTLDNAILAGNGTQTWFGIRVVNPTSRVVDGITIENSDISGFYHSGSDYSSEVETDAYPGAGINDVNILDNTLHGTSGPTSADENGVNGYSGPNYPDQPGTNLTNFTYAGNTIYDIGGKPSSGDGGNGIVANGVNGALMEYNVVHDMGANMNTCGGGAGIWAYGSNNVLIQYNEVYREEPSTYTSGCDWDGFDLDGDTTNSTVQYNYSHDNWGAGYLLYIPGSSDDTVRYNIAEDNATTTAASGYGGVTFTNGSTAGFDVYNNTIFSDGPAGTSLFTIDYGNPASTTVANNIFYSTNGANLLYTVGSSNPGSVTLTNNDYYAAGPFKISWAGKTYTSLAAFQASTTEDATGTTTDPLFVGTPPAGVCNTSSTGSTTPQPCPSIYALQASSTLIGTGLDLTRSPYSFSVGLQDYFGNAIPHSTGTGFNIGAFGGTE